MPPRSCLGGEEDSSQGKKLFERDAKGQSFKLRRAFQRWMPILKKYQVELPLECPFHESRDIFRPQQRAKHQHRPSQWTCGLCGKSFYAEKHLDAHFDNRHRSNVNTVSHRSFTSITLIYLFQFDTKIKIFLSTNETCPLTWHFYIRDIIRKGKVRVTSSSPPFYDENYRGIGRWYTYT